MRLYLMRHADPNYETDSLTPQGAREAEALAQRLAAHGLTAIYASSAGRAKATAQVTADRLSMPVQVEDWLLEPGHLKVEQQSQRYNIWDTFGETTRGRDPLPSLGDWTSQPPFDKPEVAAMWHTLRQQVDGLLTQHGYTREAGRYRIDRASDDRVAIFCHNGTLLLLLAHLLELPPPLVWCGFFFWPASVTTIYFESWSEQWAVPRALGVADVSHIRQAGLAPQPRGMGAWYAPYGA
jgi:probable phosphoglycerate mutase